MLKHPNTTQSWYALSSVVGLLVLSSLACGRAINLPSTDRRELSPLTPMQATAVSQTVSNTSGVVVFPTLAAPAAIDPDAEERLVNQVYQQTVPGVVYINVVSVVDTGSTQLPNGSQLSPDAQLQLGQGSGFVLDDVGHIVTNNHVVANARTVEVHFWDGLIARAKVVATDPYSDLAVIKVDVDSALLHPLALADSDQVFVGQRTLAIGNPFGQSWTLTTGIVSAFGRSEQASNTQFSIPKMIQTDAAINPGNSGGPLLNSQGEVLGINTMILSATRSSSGVGFAVPANIVRKVVPVLIANGHYDYPFLGISGSALSLDQLDAMNLPDTQRGVLVAETVAGGPAAQAGVQPAQRTVAVDGGELPIDGDIITAINGQVVLTMDDVVSYLVEYTKPGDQVQLSVLRAGKPLTLNLTLGKRPAAN
jgi:serine protease Do